MYFYHPDHLGSITMITDGRGNVLAGGERGGKSHITYRPYGEILRTDSFGPDISKYKYTGQEEDRESGLMYYKARYYDSKIGRFLQQDSMAFPNQVNGMNRMMYVEGNPVGFRDESGNNAIIGQLNAIMKHMMGGLKWAAKGIKNTTDRISEGKKSRKGADFGSVAPRKIKEVGEKLTNNWLSFKKIDRWFGSWNDTYRTSEKALVRRYLSDYLISNNCKKNLGDDTCSALFYLNIGLYNKEEEKSQRNPMANLWIGWWDWKIRPTNEDKEQLKTTCITYLVNSSGFGGRTDAFDIGCAFISDKY
jgi:RHS repeat-associated protein